MLSYLQAKFPDLVWKEDTVCENVYNAEYRIYIDKLNPILTYTLSANCQGNRLNSLCLYLDNFQEHLYLVLVSPVTGDTSDIVVAKYNDAVSKIISSLKAMQSENTPIK